jgi:hypothetical protein
VLGFLLAELNPSIYRVCSPFVFARGPMYTSSRVARIHCAPSFRFSFILMHTLITPCRSPLSLCSFFLRSIHVLEFENRSGRRGFRQTSASSLPLVTARTKEIKSRQLYGSLTAAPVPTMWNAGLTTAGFRSAVFY